MKCLLADKVRSDMESLQERSFGEVDVNAAFGDFDNVWSMR